MTSVEHYGLTVIIWAVTTGISTLIHDVELVFEIIGCTSVVFVGYLVPIACHSKLNLQMTLIELSHSNFFAKLPIVIHIAGCILIFIGGVLVVSFGTVSLFYH